MLLKKTTIMSALFVLLSLPGIASAGLWTDNKTSNDSTVKITSGKFFPCAGIVKGVYTPAHHKQEVSWDLVKGLCLSSGGTCTADIYMTRDCTGPVVGKATLDTVSLSIKSIYSINSKYKFYADSSTSVVLDAA